VETDPRRSDFPYPREPFLDHIRELRARLFRVFLWVALGASAGWSFSGRILDWIIAPVGSAVYINPVDPFLVRLKIALLAGLALSFPLVAWEGWRFVRPALKSGERVPLVLFLPISFGLFLLGGWLGWRVLVPVALDFLMGFGGERLTPMISIQNLVGFVGWLTVGCGILFQMPVVVVGLTRAGWVRPETLARHWRVAVVGILFLAAVVTPTPDCFNQFLVAIPVILLYAISVILSFWMGRGRRQ